MPPSRTASSRARKPQATQTRSTRATKSPSVESIGPSDNDAPTRSLRRTRARQSSVESVSSQESTAPNTKRRGKQASRKAGEPELTAVVEESEKEEDQNQDKDVEDERPNQVLQSPAMSQMSGTTALTSHSEAAINDLNPEMVEYLPDLLASSCSILDLLAPDGSELESIENTVKQLKIPNSKTSRSLKHAERKFQVDREWFGNGPYIQVEYVLRKLFNTSDIPDGDFRPDPVLYAANIATLITNFLVTSKESRSSWDYLDGLYRLFPQAFSPHSEDSLPDDIFQMALEIRTQYTIAGLFHFKEDPAWDPDKIIVDYFFEGPAQPSDSGYASDFWTNGKIKPFLRSGPPNSESQDDKVKQRVADIRRAVRHNTEASENGDVIDFEQLDEMFPWIDFLDSLIKWSQARRDIINESIKAQGYVWNITRLLIEVLKEGDSQLDVSYRAPNSTAVPEPILSAPVQGEGDPSDHDFGTTQNIARLQLLKRLSGSRKGTPSGREERIGTVSASSAHQQLSSLQPREKARSVMDAGRGSAEAIRPRNEYLSSWNDQSNERNKENLPGAEVVQDKVASHQKSYMDRQPGARKHKALEDDDEPSQPKKRRARDSESVSERGGEEDDGQSEDGGFEADTRPIDPARRVAAPTGRHRSPVHESSAQPSLDEERFEARREDAERAPQRSASNEIEDDSEDNDAELPLEHRGNADDDDVEELAEVPLPPFSQIVRGRKLKAARAMQQKPAGQEPQGRTPWSDDDSDRLVELIENWGTSWSKLFKIAKDENLFDRDFHPDAAKAQIALRDRAQNMKIGYLQAGSPLPKNFDEVALKASQVSKLQNQGVDI